MFNAVEKTRSMAVRGQEGIAISKLRWSGFSQPE